MYKKLYLSCLLLCLATIELANATDDGLIHMPLEFQQNFIRTRGNVRAEMSYLAGKYNLKSTTGSKTQLKNTMNMEYTCIMGIGTPEQKFRVLPDTGSSNIWVPGTKCRSKACKVHTRYIPKKSSTYKKMGNKFSIVYGSGSVKGVLAKDTVHIAGLKVVNQTFAMTTREPGTTFVSADFDGIVGLGYRSISVDNANTLPNNMCAQGVIKHCIFSVYMRGGGTSQRGGELIFGGVDSSKYKGNLIYTPVTKEGYWQFNLQGFWLGNKKIGDAAPAIVDTGTSLIAAPPAAYHALNKQLGCTETSSGECVLSCKKKIPKVGFTIAGKRFVMRGQNLKLKVKTSRGKTVCISAVTNMGSDMWILGDAFIRHFYVVFDLQQNRIGFAPSK